MLIYPFISLFLSTLFISTIIIISSFHWLIVWIALELNIISFIPIITSSFWIQESESALKYLLFQAIGSSLILLGISNSIITFFILIGLLIKLGAAPFHYWFPSMIKGTSWSTAILLITWQKIGPFILIISLFSSSIFLLTTTGILRSLVGGFGGLMQTHFRSLLAYSSIGHIGWIAAVIPISPFCSFFYLIIYIILSLPIIIILKKENISLIKQIKKPITIGYSLVLIIFIVSLGGLPPFLGFLPKIIVIYQIDNILTILFLILGSLINLFYYLNITFSLFLFNPNYKNFFLKNINFSLSLFLIITCNPLPFFLLVI